MLATTVPAGMGIVGVRQQVGVCQKPTLAQQPPCLLQHLQLLLDFAQVMQRLYRHKGVDLPSPAHFDQLGAPVIGHEIGAPKRQDSAVAPLTRVYFEPAPSEVNQVSRKIEATIADARQLPLKALSQKAGAAGQLNDPG
ncbi:MAG: hypothetical protein OXG26_11865 [Caldilineaceae bacterium]|nr:hypothetical protein [Caldilineaceae bacterium]